MTVHFEADLKDLGKFERKLAAILKAKIANAMKIAANQSIPVLSWATMKAPPASNSQRSNVGAYATGKYMSKWEVWHSAMNMTVEIHNQTSYAAFIEYGVRPKKFRPGPLTLDMLTKWVQQKGIKITTREGRKLSDRSAARLIMWSIKKRKVWALKPRNVGRTAFMRVKDIFNARIKEAYQRAIAEAALEAATKGRGTRRR